MNVGLSQVEITPPGLEEGIDLAGVRASRMRRAYHRLDDLRVRVAWFRGEDDLVLVNGDVLYFPAEMCSRISSWAEERFKTGAGQVVFNATHTHCAPHLGGTFLDGARVSRAYAAFVDEAIRAALTRAHDDIQEAEVLIGTRTCRAGINRRKQILNTRELLRGRIRIDMANMPNRKGVVDRDLVVVKVIRDGEVSALLLNYGCHANARLAAAVSADFPGEIAKAFESFFQRPVPVLFLQGFSGNVRPLVVPSWKKLLRSPRGLLSGMVHGRPFDKGPADQALRRIARQFVDAAMSDGPFETVETVSRAREVDIPLPLDGPAGQAHVSMKARKIDFGESSSFLCVPAEVFCEYGIRLKRRLAPRRVIPMGCTGGMIGYIPTAEAVRAGGYEAKRSCRLFGLPQPFDESIERVFTEGVLSLFKDSH